MGRKNDKGIMDLMFGIHSNNVRREIEKSRRQRQSEISQRHRELEKEKAARQRARSKKQSERDKHENHLKELSDKADEINEAIDDYIQKLNTILDGAFEVQENTVDRMLDFYKSIKGHFREFEIPRELDPKAIQEDQTLLRYINQVTGQLPEPQELVVVPGSPPKIEDYTTGIKPLGLIDSIMPGAKRKHALLLYEADRKYKAALKIYEDSESTRLKKIEELRKQYENEKDEFDNKINVTIEYYESIKNGYADGSVDSIEKYIACIPHGIKPSLDLSSFTTDRWNFEDIASDFPTDGDVAYDSNEKELTINYNLPKPDVVPSIRKIKYIKSADDIKEFEIQKSELKQIYENVLTGLALRIIYTVFFDDFNQTIRSIIFNGYVDGADPATGKDAQLFLISVRVARDAFNDINLAAINKMECLKSLGAVISPRLLELQAIKPLTPSVSGSNS